MSHTKPLHLKSNLLRRDSDERDRRIEAARRIQRFWRQRNQAKVKYLTAHARWDEATDKTQLEASNAGVARKESNPSSARWRRVRILTGRLQDGNNMLHDAGVEVENATRKQMETQHWLELIDGKHRYGSNLKYYFKKWKDADTEDNFFRWLDYGDGKDLDLKECPRQQLEKERISYLSSEQRLNYLVNVDSDGKLRWARNDQLVDTTAGHWKDAGHGQGIVPIEVSDASEPQPPDAAVSSDSLASQALNDAAMHYVGPPKGNNKLTRAFWRNFTIHGMIDKLLRKTVQRNTWIYVSDKNFNMFIGIKVAGTFQHSSFLSGGIVTSAGLISVKDGIIHTLSPLSGHYRTSIDGFRRYLEVLGQRGVNMKKVQISKAETALWLIEHINKGKKAQGRFVDKSKKKMKDAATDVAELPSRLSDLNWKSEVLEGRKKNKVTAEKDSADIKKADRPGQENGATEAMLSGPSSQETNKSEHPTDLPPAVNDTTRRPEETKEREGD